MISWCTFGEKRMRFTLVFCTKNHVIQFFDGFAKSIETLRTSKRTSSSILHSWNGCQIKTPNCQRFKMSPAIQESCPLKIISVTVFWRKKHCLYNGFFPFSTMNSPICFVEFHTKTAWGLQDPQWRAFIRILFSKKKTFGPEMFCDDHFSCLKNFRTKHKSPVLKTLPQIASTLPV